MNMKTFFIIIAILTITLSSMILTVVAHAAEPTLIQKAEAKTIQYAQQCAQSANNPELMQKFRKELLLENSIQIKPHAVPIMYFWGCVSGGTDAVTKEVFTYLESQGYIVILKEPTDL